ncbi:hypothetical protein [Micromonospora rifamycinica]|uniref:hypothetical protein n=1 Tax=Micromonospora rifamycinica TaxID=291594 RepID=UPI0012FA60E4|nr:hypothetical protein [Micromonospora rifamycinica]
MDETKERGFLLVAATLDTSYLTAARATVGRLVFRGQRSIHFCKERDERRRQILRAFRDLPVEIVIYDATAYRNVKRARDACLRGLVSDAAKAAAERLVLDLDESCLGSDRSLLGRELGAVGMAGRLRYDHLDAHADHLLAIPDAVAWSWAKGGQWRAMVRRMIGEVRNV